MICHIRPSSSATTRPAQPPPSGPSISAAPVRHHPLADLRRLVLRHTYGTVTAISSDSTSITIDKDFPTLPAAVAGNRDHRNPDTHDSGRCDQRHAVLRCGCQDGHHHRQLLGRDQPRMANSCASPPATSRTARWSRPASGRAAPSTAVWLSPEGHVLNVNPNTDIITVTNEAGIGVPLTVNANTKFFYRQPWNAAADATPIGTGTALRHQPEHRARLQGACQCRGSPRGAAGRAGNRHRNRATTRAPSRRQAAAASPTRTTSCAPWTTTRVTLSYIAAATANGNDPATGTAITGYKWWNFAFPTIVDSGANAVSDFVSATNGTASFGGTAGAIIPWGVSYVVWADPANATGWSAASVHPGTHAACRSAPSPARRWRHECGNLHDHGGQWGNPGDGDCEHGQRLGHAGVPGGHERRRGDA